MVVFFFQAYFIGCVWSCYKILVNFRVKQATSAFLFHVQSDENEVRALCSSQKSFCLTSPIKMYIGSHRNSTACCMWAFLSPFSCYRYITLNYVIFLPDSELVAKL